MTVSTLKEIEACPRRWALANASYPEIWDRPGYPPRLNTPSLLGTAVHMILEKIVRALVRAGCSSLADAKCPAVMKQLGGYTNIATETIEALIARLEGNPRAAPMREEISRRLRGHIPEMRAQAQAILARMNLGAPAQPPPQAASKSEGARGALTQGTYAEIELRAPRIGWKGKVDLLSLSGACCDLVDFKTGARDQSHVFQVRAYAYLWSADAELNPKAKLVTGVTLSYRDGDVAVAPPSREELIAIERELVERTDRATMEIGARPPKALPTVDNCRFCTVRQLCDPYWTSPPLPEEEEKSNFADLELRIVRRHGPTSWDAIECQRAGRASTPVLLRAPAGVADLHPGDVVRVLGVLVTDDDDGGPSVATMTSATELFKARPA